MCESGEVPVSLASTFIKETADKKTQGRIAKGGKAAIVADMKSSDEPVEAAVDPGEDFDVDARGDRLCDWLRHELDQWPQEHLGEALHWIVQIATKEFKA